MARRSEHTREQLREMIVREGYDQIASFGYAQFSARNVAKKIGYSIGTLYNVFETHERMILSINGYTLDKWRDYLVICMKDYNGDRLEGLIRAYFGFARENSNVWHAIYDFHWNSEAELPQFYSEKVMAIFSMIRDEVENCLPAHKKPRAHEIAQSLLATVHGHCVMALSGTYALLGKASALDDALIRVKEAIGLS